jgi:hypothetical protein
MAKPEDAEGWNYYPVSEIHCRNRENAAPRIPYAFDFKYRLAANNRSSGEDQRRKASSPTRFRISLPG